METMIGYPTDSVINRFEDLTPGVGMTARGGVKARGPARRFPLTSRDIEAEVLVRLAHKGYDWTGTLDEGRAP
jgi:hypothetical protein